MFSKINGSFKVLTKKSNFICMDYVFTIMVNFVIDVHYTCKYCSGPTFLQ